MVGWLYNTCLQRLYLLAVLFFNSAAGDLLRGVEVPQFAVAGGQARVSCFYDLRTTKLYSLKWYHNSTEFYRYVPTERNRAINIKPTHKFSVAELFRNERQVSLSLTKLAIAATGHYRCEVIAEHPSFRTEASTASMTVLREPLAPPILVDAREIYETTDLIKIGCQPRQPLFHGYTPTLQWFLDGSQVSADKVKLYSDGSYKTKGLLLHISGQQVAAAGGTLKAECRMTLGTFTLSSFKTLRVRVRLISYVGTYQSPANQWKARIMLTSVMVFIPVHFNLL
ncbi:uncharacterized protein LOC121863624 [Homarus americanus]|uniref:uncharacterized protein LOC121863624 n=1 Tax=Homarus americanus TaxID=6706 RepID=UPI001C45C54E|nr:uncharacterized protein LOC121863624 [Homarus americanus]